MTFNLEFVVPGVPVPKGRARITTKNGYALAYTPARTAKYEQDVATLARQAMGVLRPFSGPVELWLAIGVQIPASWSKKKRLEASSGALLPIGRPDASNIVKAIEDGMNGVVYDDDSQIVTIQATKRYTYTPGVHVRVTGVTHGHQCQGIF